MKAKLAAGIPRKGDALNGSYPAVIASNISSRTLGGKDNGSGENGWSEVVVDYIDLITLPITTLPVNTKHTVFTVNNESVEVGAAVTDAGTPVINKVFNNKKSASKLIGRCTAEVYDFRPLNYSVPIGTLVSLASDKAMNSDTVTLPPLLGNTVGTIMAAKQILYMGFKTEVTTSGCQLIVHQLQLAVDFNLRWAVPDINGNILRVDTGQLYRTAAFAGLW